MERILLKMEDLIGKKVRGFKFEYSNGVFYTDEMDKHIDEIGCIIRVFREGLVAVQFKSDWFHYPLSLIEQHLVEEPNTNEPSFKDITDSLSSLLEHKNKNYGNSALEPLEVFGNKCKVGTRLDDKLARVKNSEELRRNDVVDLLGYLVLTCKEKGWTNFDDLKD